MKFAKGVHDVAFEIAAVANSWLVHRNEEGLRKTMTRKGLL
jgi:hypothetical protein